MINLSNTTPAAPAGNVNISWQSDSNGNVSAYAPSPSEAITLQTNGVDTSSQSVLNLVSGNNVTITNTSGGNVTISANMSGGGGSNLVLETNGTLNSNQDLLNLIAGANVTLTNSGGNVTISANASGSGSNIALMNNGNVNSSQSVLNLTSGNNITITDNGNGNISIASSGGGSSGAIVSIPTGDQAIYQPVNTTFSILQDGANVFDVYNSGVSVVCEVGADAYSSTVHGSVVLLTSPASHGTATVSATGSDAQVLIDCSDGGFGVVGIQSSGVIYLSATTTNPWSPISFRSSVSFQTNTITGNYSVAVTDHTILANAASGALTVTLPNADKANYYDNADVGLLFRIKKIDSSSNDVTVTASSGDLDGNSTVTLSTPNQYIVVQSDGTNWWLV